MRFRTPEVRQFVAANAALDPDPVLIMRARAAALVADYQARFGAELPLDMELLAALRGIRVLRKPLAEDVSGELIALPEGLLARINAAHTPGRQNFSIGHEIAHTFFPQYREVRYRREKSTYWTSAAIAETSGLNPEVEYLCDLGASELLMPRKIFAAELDRRTLSLAAILELADLFGASIEAAVIRIIQETPEPAAVVFCHQALKPSEQRSGAGRAAPRLRVRRAYCSRSFGGFIPPHCSVPEGNPFHQAGEAEEIIAGETSIRFGSGDYFVRQLRYEIAALSPLEESPDQKPVIGLFLNHRSGEAGWSTFR